jgi:ATP-dependent protease ClpP protease subunit
MEQADPSPTAKDYCPVFCTQYTDHRQFDAYLTGEITCVRSYLNLIDILLAANENDVINIYIDSPGGRISAGGLIASAIDSSKATVRTFARGLCASAAALVHSAAKRGNAFVSDFALMLYHMSSHVDEGVSTHIRARADVQVNYVNKVLLRKALEDGHITKEEFENLQSGENIIISGKEWNRRTQVTKD